MIIFRKHSTYIIMILQLHKMLDISQCWDIVRQVRWSEGVSCPNCKGKDCRKNGKDKPQIYNQKYHCKSCGKYFDDLTDTIFSNSQLPLEHWIVALYLMHLNVSNSQIAEELDISVVTAQRICSKLREGIVKKNLVYHLAEKLRLTNVI